jgi:ketosteroid isomerase-like protein
MSDIQNVPQSVAAFVDAINRADTDAFVALFAVDGLVNDWGTEYRGHARIRHWAGSDAIGAGARMKILSATVDGDTTTIRFDWRSRVFQGNPRASSSLATRSEASPSRPRTERIILRKVTVVNRFSLLLALASGFFIAAVVAAFTIGWFAPIACAILGTPR